MHLTAGESKIRDSGVKGAFGSSRRVSFKATVEVVFSVDQIIVRHRYSKWLIGDRSFL